MENDGVRLITTQAPALIFGIPVTFVLGVLAGQFSVILLAIVLLRLIIFEHPRSTTKTLRNRTPLDARKSRHNVPSVSNVQDTNLESDADIARIMFDLMSKVYYEIDSHAAETIDWLNVIIAQALAGYRQDMHRGGWYGAGQSESDATANGSSTQSSAQDWMEAVLNSHTTGKGMTFLDPIRVTHIDLGDAYPILSNAKVRPADDLGRMRVEVDIDFHDCICLAIDTKLLVNIPRPRFAVLPISLGLTIERFSGTLAVELFSNTSSTVVPKPANASSPSRANGSRHELHFSLHPDFNFDASASSLVGSRAKLQDLPKIEQLLVGRIRTYIHERFVWPRYWSVPLPNLVPRSASNDSRAGNPARVDVWNEEDVKSPFGRRYEARNDREASTTHNLPCGGSELSEGIREDHSIPGTLPLSVEAWREQSANVGSHRDIRRRRGS